MKLHSNKCQLLFATIHDTIKVKKSPLMINHNIKNEAHLKIYVPPSSKLLTLICWVHEVDGSLHSTLLSKHCPGLPLRCEERGATQHTPRLKVNIPGIGIVVGDSCNWKEKVVNKFCKYISKICWFYSQWASKDMPYVGCFLELKEWKYFALCFKEISVHFKVSIPKIWIMTADSWNWK